MAGTSRVSATPEFHEKPVQKVHGMPTPADFADQHRQLALADHPESLAFFALLTDGTVSN